MGSGAEAKYPFSPATVATIRVTAGDEMNKTMLLGLRLTRKGLRAEDFRARFGIGLEEKYDGILQKLRARQLMDWDVCGVRPTKQRRMPGDIECREFVWGPELQRTHKFVGAADGRSPVQVLV